MTMPNEALTVRQIIERYAQGIPVSQNTDGYYDDPDDMDMSDFDNLDFFEKMQYILDNKEYIKQLEERVEQESLKQQAPEGQDDRTVVDPPTENK